MEILATLAGIGCFAAVGALGFVTGLIGRVEALVIYGPAMMGLGVLGWYLI